jgi:hypothetical protein
MPTKNKKYEHLHKIFFKILMMLIIFLSKNSNSQHVINPYFNDGEKKIINNDLKKAGEECFEKYSLNSSKFKESWILVNFYEKSKGILDDSNIKREYIIEIFIYFKPLESNDKKDEKFINLYLKLSKNEFTENFKNLQEILTRDFFNKNNTNIEYNVTLIDGEQIYYWEINKNKENPEEKELFIPYIAKINPIQKASNWHFHPLHITYDNAILPELYEGLLNYSKSGFVTNDHAINIERIQDETLKTLNFNIEYKPPQKSDKAKSIINWNIDTKSGLPNKYEVFNTLKNGTESIYSYKNIIEPISVSSDINMYIPIAWDILRSTPFPSVLSRKGAETTHIDRTRGVVLFAEFDKPSHRNHPALEPDSLAAWLGVPLEWENPEGCRVTSYPKGWELNAGLPRCKLLEEIFLQLESGELEVDWPFEEEEKEGHDSFASTE